MPNEVLRQQKRRQLAKMLDRGMVMIHLDPRREGVDVPPRFRDDLVLRLNIAYGFRLPALEIDAEGVFAVLSFNRQNYPCTIPWDAIFALTAPHDGHEGMVWPESSPPELAAEFTSAGVRGGATPVSLRAEPSPPEPAAPRPVAARQQAPEPDPAPRPLLVVHEGGRSDEDDAPEPRGGPEARPSSRPVLTVVKD